MVTTIIKVELNENEKKVKIYMDTILDEKSKPDELELTKEFQQIILTIFDAMQDAKLIKELRKINLDNLNN